MNHPQDGSKLEIASGTAIRAFRTAVVWRQKLQTDEVKLGKGWLHPRGACRTPPQREKLLGGFGISS